MLNWKSCVDNNIGWLLESGEPWTAYRTRLDLLGQSEGECAVQKERLALLDHPQVKVLIASAGSWLGYALRRHNDAGHPLYAFSTLADFGIHASDPGMERAITVVMAHQSAVGAFQSLVSIPKAFGGIDEDQRAWMLCDAPTLLYALVMMGKQQDPQVKRAGLHLAGLVQENGWRCTAAPELGKFKGPGRRADPCPIANVYALKALCFFPEHLHSPATHLGVESLLNHWQRRAEYRPYLFGIGSDFCKLKYPFVWYDLLHVVEVLSHYDFIHLDPRFREMLDAILTQANSQGQFTARSMYQPWRGWSFADKKNPSPWLTFLVYRILQRITSHCQNYGD